MKIFLVGVGCVGKSTIGKQFAKDTGYKFIDFDTEVENFFGRSIPELKKKFKTEYLYRKNISKVLSKIMKENEFELIIVALPPSGLCDWFWEIIKKSDWVTIFLDDTAENILKRIVFYDYNSNIMKRTLTEKEKPLYLHEIEEDIKYFKQFYKKANYRIDIDGLDVVGSVEKLKNLVRDEGAKRP